MTAAYLWVALGGAAGSVMRYGIGGMVAEKYGETFPFGTLAVNVAGSFLIGFVAALAGPEGRLPAHVRVVAAQVFMAGVCGGFTTFSSFSLQTLSLMRNGEWLSAGANVVFSVVLCLFATWLGFALGAMVNNLKGS